MRAWFSVPIIKGVRTGISERQPRGAGLSDVRDGRENLVHRLDADADRPCDMAFRHG
jgi:hypothetical protein